MSLQYADLRKAAQSRLAAAAYSPRRLVLIHTAVSLGASLLIGLLNLLFSQLIAKTGGLSGLSTRSALQTAQMTIETIVMVLLPFWNIGLTRAALCWARGESAEVPTLLEGFRRMRSVFGIKLLTALVFFAVSLAVSNIATVLFLFTPFAGKLTAALAPVMENAGALDPETLLSDETLAQLGSAAAPLLIFAAVIFAAVAIPVWYRIRFADFAVMDGGRSLFSMLHSFRITGKKAMAIFKIDLQLWWFYVLQGLSVAACYGDSILAALGVSLPMSGEAAYVLFYAVGIVLQGLLLWWYQAQVSTVYALAYETLCAESELKIKS